MLGFITVPVAGVHKQIQANNQVKFKLINQSCYIRNTETDLLEFAKNYDIMELRTTAVAVHG